jgi:hypothetical protein
MILVNGDSFTSGEESPVAWPSLIPNTVNLATPGASNDHIVMSTIEYIESHTDVTGVIIAWTTPHRICISGKHLTPTSERRYGSIVEHVFSDWDEEWAWRKFQHSVHMLHGYLSYRSIPHVFLSTFDIPAGSMDGRWYWMEWQSEGIVEWMGDCPKGPGGHPLELGHKRIAERINEYIRNLGWLP